ncbi:MAG: DUF1003 domain-containing protein [Bacteroidia bacterium]|nr:DUF1003 domain-containing protein [Bacteroidia bacterium]
MSQTSIKNKEFKNILQTENARIQKLHKIVEDSIKEEELVMQNLLNPPSEELSRGQKISDKVARFGGSWRFIILFLMVMMIWIIFNVVALSSSLRFDPFPFILLNLILSCIAAIQAPIIMMSQNRQEEKDRKRSENDYLINLKAEMQIRSLHQKMDMLIEEQIKALFETQAQQFELLYKIEKKLNQNIK